MRVIYTKRTQTATLLHKVSKGETILIDWAGYQGPAIVMDSCTPELSSLRSVFLLNKAETRTVPMDLEVEIVEAELHITMPNTAKVPTPGIAGHSYKEKIDLIEEHNYRITGGYEGAKKCAEDLIANTNAETFSTSSMGEIIRDKKGNTQKF